MIWLDLLCGVFLFSRRRDFVERKVSGCASKKFLLSSQSLVALSFAKLLQTILDNDFMVGFKL